MARSNVISIRLDDRVKYLVDLAAARVQRSISSYIAELLRVETQFLGEMWHPEPVERFILLATRMPHLLPPEAAEAWTALTAQVTPELAATYVRENWEEVQAAYDVVDSPAGQ